tara:strand:- start:240 stop:644 length:405 start_codon:yes stop_codon:yes gene_type:complete
MGVITEGLKIGKKLLKGKKKDKKLTKQQREAKRKKEEKAAEIADLKKRSKTVTEGGVKVTKVPPQKDPSKVTVQEKFKPGSEALRPDASYPTHTKAGFWERKVDQRGQTFKKGGPVKKSIDGIATKGLTRAKHK